MEIIAITKNNIANCVETFIATYNHEPWNYSWKFTDAIKYLNEYVESPQFKGFMIYDENSLAGALLGHMKTWWTNDQFVIDEFFVDPARQGKGYGKLLLWQAEEFARENNIRLIILMTNKFMPALQFYDKNEFIKVEQYIFMFKQI